MRVNDVCPLIHRAECTPCCLTFISKQWQFAAYLMVIFPRKLQVKESVISNDSTPDHRHHSAEKDKPGPSGNTCFCESQSRFQALQLRCTCHGPGPGGGGTQSLPGKEMAHCRLHGWRIRYHSPKNHWKVSVHPVLQLSWEFGRRERIQERAALWQQRISHPNWDKVQRKGSATPSLETKGMQQLIKMGPKHTTLSPVYYTLPNFWGAPNSCACFQTLAEKQYNETPTCKWTFA